MRGACGVGLFMFDLVGELTARTRKHGKRFRPVLAHWAWVAGDGDHRTSEHIVRVAAALELLQLFALIQDDVMDRSQSRRGRTCLHMSAAEQHRTADGLGDAGPPRRQDRALGLHRETASTASVTMSYP